MCGHACERSHWGPSVEPPAGPRTRVGRAKLLATMVMIILKRFAHPHRPIQKRCASELRRSGKCCSKEGGGRTAQRSEEEKDEVDGWIDG
eukprot:5905548-Pyramimonas_sp.AAC.1